jgi:UPF0755 protein
LGGGWVGFEWSRPYQHFAEKEKYLQVPRKTGSYQVARMLQREGVISHWFWFLCYVKTIQRNRPLQAGEYRFDQPLTIPQVAYKLIHGQIYYHEVTIPEGYSLYEIADLLEQQKLTNRSQFWAAVERTDLISVFFPEAKTLEGFLFPDTYRFSRQATALQIVQTMVERFRQVYHKHLEKAWNSSSMNGREIVTLASLIEKETGGNDELDKVSAVLVNRLHLGMPLQCDPTVIYAAKLNGSYKGEILQADLESKSAYNTYLHAGLPPGPIANPGLKSLLAALNPAQVDFLYFVSNNHGGHVFSRNLEQHNRAVAAYRRGTK